MFMILTRFIHQDHFHKWPQILWILSNKTNCKNIVNMQSREKKKLNVAMPNSVAFKMSINCSKFHVEVFYYSVIMLKEWFWSLKCAVLVKVCEGSDRVAPPWDQTQTGSEVRQTENRPEFHTHFHEINSWNISWAHLWTTHTSAAPQTEETPRIRWDEMRWASTLLN